MRTNHETANFGPKMAFLDSYDGLKLYVVPQPILVSKKIFN